MTPTPEQIEAARKCICIYVEGDDVCPEACETCRDKAVAALTAAAEVGQRVEGVVGMDPKIHARIKEREFATAQYPKASTVTADPEISIAHDEIERLRTALEEIALGRGAYDPDRLRHAANCIDEMKEIARKALEGK